MTIRTASIREIKKLPKTAYKVLVMRYFPFYIKGLKNHIDEFVPILGPNVDLFKDYRTELKRTNEARIAWEISKYDSRYRRSIMNGVKSMEELRRIAKISTERKGKRVVYLICHEATDDYCHRRILKELMELAVSRGWCK